MLAVQARRRRVETIEGLSDTRRDRRPAGGVPRAQRAAVRLLHAGHAAGRAGAARARAASRRRDEIREHLSGNYCRCTGYQAIVDAVETVGEAATGRPSHERRARSPAVSVLDRPNSYIGQLGAAPERARACVQGRGAVRRRHRAAAHGARRLRAQPARPCPDRRASIASDGAKRAGRASRVVDRRRARRSTARPGSACSRTSRA